VAVKDREELIKRKKKKNDPNGNGIGGKVTVRQRKGISNKEKHQGYQKRLIA